MSKMKISGFWRFYPFKSHCKLKTCCPQPISFRKSRLRETPTLSTDADSRTNTNLKRLVDYLFCFFKRRREKKKIPYEVILPFKHVIIYLHTPGSHRSARGFTIFQLILFIFIRQGHTISNFIFPLLRVLCLVLP